MLASIDLTVNICYALAIVGGVGFVFGVLGAIEQALSKGE